jgi:hypothetical protein
MMTTPARAVALAVALALAAGCGDDDEPSTEEATAELCAARDDVSAQIQAASDLNLGDLSADSLEEAVDSVGDRIGEVRDAANQVIGDRWQEVEDAFDEVRTAVGNIGSDLPLQESVTAVRTAAGDLKTAVEAAFSGLQC